MSDLNFLSDIAGREITFRSHGDVLFGVVRELKEDRTLLVGSRDDFGPVECVVSPADIIKVGNRVS
jgi:hypothetical protein